MFWDHKGRQWTDTDAAFDLLDVGGYNYMWRAYEKDHARAPRRVMAATESTTLEAFDYWSAVERLPYLIGDFVWTGLDYLGEVGLGRAFIVGDQPDEFNAPWPWYIAGSGDIDILGDRKPQSFYREALWRPDVLHVTVHRPVPEGRKEKVTMWGWPLVESHWTWPGQEGRPLKVAVYSSCNRVALALNGQAIGEKPTGAAERRMAEFDVAYAARHPDRRMRRQPDESVARDRRASRTPARDGRPRARAGESERPGVRPHRGRGLEGCDRPVRQRRRPSAAQRARRARSTGERGPGGQQRVQRSVAAALPGRRAGDSAAERGRDDSARGGGGRPCAGAAGDHGPLTQASPTDSTPPSSSLQPSTPSSAPLR